MSNDRNRPLYKLCDRITLPRISAEHYQHHLQKAAQKQWKKPLSDSALDAILTLTQRDPYYVNLLCARLWRLTAPPTDHQVSDCWANYLIEERTQAAAELALLSTHQRKLLIALARHGGTDSPTSHAFQLIAKMPASTIKQALAFLEKQDFVYRNDNNHVMVLDPMLAAILAK